MTEFTEITTDDVADLDLGTGEPHHHEVVTDPARVGISEEQPGDEDSRLGTCPECGERFLEVVAHAAVAHPELNLGIPTDPDELRALADRIEAARAADGVRAEQNAQGGIDYAVDIDDELTGTDEVH